MIDIKKIVDSYRFFKSVVVSLEFRKEKMKLQNEYLIIVDKETSSGFYTLCSSVKRFNESIIDKKNITVNNQKKTISNENIIIKYNVKMGEVKGKEQRFFYITFIFDDDEEKISDYKNIIRDVKSILYDNQTIIETLKDDLSFFYSKKAYSLVHEIENLMRKFITYFMITNIGKNWIENSSPSQIKKVLEKSKRSEYIDVLQKLDFIHLGDFLFKAYQEDDVSKLFDEIKNLSVSEDINIENLKKHIPSSNWDKFFKEKVDCDDKYLETRWKKLYELRNKIAHTSHFTEKDYLEINTLVNDVKEKLENAFEKIDTLEVQDNEKELLSESIVININDINKKYLEQYNILQKELKSYIQNGEYKKQISNYYINNLETSKIIDKQLKEKIKEFSIIRNNLVHNINFNNNEFLYKYYKELETLNTELQYSWKEEVINALKILGGEATLEQIYKHIEKNTKRNLSETWKSSVRKTLYIHSSDTDTFSGKEDLFKHLDKGKWALRE